MGEEYGPKQRVAKQLSIPGSLPPPSRSAAHGQQGRRVFTETPTQCQFIRDHDVWLPLLENSKARKSYAALRERRSLSAMGTRPVEGGNPLRIDGPVSPKKVRDISPAGNNIKRFTAFL